MGAVWSEGEGPVGRPERDDPFKALLRAIDLRRLRPYHAPTRAVAARAAESAVPAGRGRPVGLWLREDETMREFGVERMRSWLRFILHTDDTPPRAAMAFALGVFIAWTPTFGLHTLIGLALAFLLGLNRVAVLAGTLVNNPWTIVPIYSASVYLGSLVLGRDLEAPRLEGVSTWGDIGEFLVQCRPWIVPLTTGTLLLGAACALLSFPIVLYGIRWYRALRQAR